MPSSAVQEGIHSIILPDIFSSGGSQNLYIDKYGRAKRILGYDNQNASALTTNTGGSATRVRGLFPYKQTAGGTTTRRLIGAFDDATDEWELHYSNDSGATWTFLYDAGAGIRRPDPRLRAVWRRSLHRQRESRSAEALRHHDRRRGRDAEPDPDRRGERERGPLARQLQIQARLDGLGVRQAGSATSRRPRRAGQADHALVDGRCQCLSDRL
jgi:hypothetical protein